MEMPIIYGLDYVPSVRSVLLTAKTIGLKIKYNRIRFLEGEHLERWFIEMNPKNSIPFMVHDDFILCDAHVISQYLIDSFAPDHFLYPKELRTRMRINERLFFNANILYSELRNVDYQIKMLNKREISPDQVDRIVDGYIYLNNYLTKTKWVATNHYTIADFHCLPTVTSLAVVCPIDTNRFPFIEYWMQRSEQKWRYYKKVEEYGRNLFAEILGEKLLQK